MSIEPEAISQAIDAALDSLAKSAAAFAGKPEDFEHYREFMARSIVTSPEQYTGDDFRPDVLLPFNAVAQLLAVIHRLRFELDHAGQYVDAHQRLESRLNEAWNIYTDPRETNRNVYARKALDKLGFKRRRSYGKKMMLEYDRLTQAVGSEDALESLGRKNKKQGDTIKKGLQRSRKKRRD